MAKREANLLISVCAEAHKLDRERIEWRKGGLRRWKEENIKQKALSMPCGIYISVDVTVGD